MCHFKPVQVIIQTSRVIFIKHRAGYVLPVILQVNSFAGSVVAIAQKLTVADEYAWFFSNSLRMTAATHGAMRLLGVRAHAVVPDVVPMITPVLLRAATD